MNLIKWIESTPRGWEKIADGLFKAEMKPVLAVLMLKIPNGEYVVAELQNALMRAVKNNPSLVSQYDLDGQLYYILGGPKVGVDFGTSEVPFQILARKKGS